MAQIINSNSSALNAQRNLTASQSSLATSLTRLSSGLRINSAKDDAAGLAISERMTAQVRGTNQAIRNANDGVSLAQTAEGALTEASTVLQRMRELAVQSANASNSSGDRAALNAEVNQLLSEVDRISSQTMFNGKKILDGTFQGMQFQVGANAYESIGISILGSSTSILRNNSVTLQGASAGLGRTVAAAATAPSGNGVNGGTELTINGAAGNATVAIEDNDQANTIAAGVNAAAASTGVTATARTTATISTASAAGNVTMSINGGGAEKNVAAAVTTGDLTALAVAINEVSGSTGVTATLAAGGASLELVQADGKDISVTNFYNSAGGTISAGGVSLTSGGNDSTRIAGVVTLNSARAFSATTGDTVAIATSAQVAASSLLSAVDITTADGANAALAVLDSALTQVSSMRANLGAVQNRFESTIRNLQSVAENTDTARSRIQDADFATETAALSRAQILQQAGTAMLAQANALPQNVLTLLR